MKVLWAPFPGYASLSRCHGNPWFLLELTSPAQKQHNATPTAVLHRVLELVYCWHTFAALAPRLQLKILSLDTEDDETITGFTTTVPEVLKYYCTVRTVVVVESLYCCRNGGWAWSVLGDG